MVELDVLISIIELRVVGIDLVLVAVSAKAGISVSFVGNRLFSEISGLLK